MLGLCVRNERGFSSRLFRLAENMLEDRAIIRNDMRFDHGCRLILRALRGRIKRLQASVKYGLKRMFFEVGVQAYPPAA